MLERLFRRYRPQLPTSSAELAEALRTAAQFADSDSAKLEYTNAADALDRAITHTRQHGDEPTRDALAYALGRAELNLKDQMSELIEVTKEIHINVQDVQATQTEQGAVVFALRAEFQQVGERLNDVEGRTAQLEATVAEHSQSRDRSIEDRGLLRQDMDESKAHRARLQTGQEAMNQRLDTALPAIEAAIRDLNIRHGGQITHLAGQLQEIQRLLEIAGNHDDGHEAGG